MREQEAARHALLTGTPLPPLPPLAAVHTPHTHTSEFDTRSPPPSPTAGPTPGPSSSSSSSAPSHSSSGGQLLLGDESGHAWSGGTKGKRQLEEKLREMKHRELSLREERKRECERRKEVERQLKALQKERYLQGLKVKYLETKLEKADGNKSDIRRRAKMESQASSSLQKEVEALQMNLSSREKALREKEEELSEIKRHCSRLMEGGTENCSLDELEQLEQILENSRNVVLERIKKKMKEEVDDKTKCLICCDRTKAIIFVPCGHRVCCVQCSNEVHTCPVCRAPIEIKQKVFE